VTKREEDKETDPSEIFGGMLNIMGLKLDLGELLSSPEKLQGQLEELREKLKAAGGKETLSDEEWKAGGASITGHIRTRGLLGDQEFHIGTMGQPRSRINRQPAPEPPEVVEPPVDVFDEGQTVTVVAEVPGVGLEDLELKVEGSTFFISTKPTARRSYRKELCLETELDGDSMEATCHNGVLEAHLGKKN